MLSQPHAFATRDPKCLGAHPANPEFMRSLIYSTCLPLFLRSYKIYVTIGILHLATSQLPLSILRHFSHEIPIGDLANNTMALADLYHRSALLSLYSSYVHTKTSLCLCKILWSAELCEISLDDFVRLFPLVKIPKKEEVSLHETHCLLTNLQRFSEPSTTASPTLILQ
jgi:hypothetical protein